MNVITEDIKNKNVILRCDLNVPIKDGQITDDTKIFRSLKTINFLLDRNNKVIILSHLGKVKCEEDKLKNSLKIIVERLSILLKRNITFINKCYGSDVKKIIISKKLGDIIVLENTRIMDYPDKLESNNNLVLAKYWANLADLFVLDAFGSMHRCHSSVCGIANFIPCYFGFLVANELTHLADLVNNVSKPFTVIMGGAKVEDKLLIIKKIITKCDYLLLGGGIANSFLYANNIDVGDSLRTQDENLIKEIRKLYLNNQNKIILPIDFVKKENRILDIGSESIALYKKYIDNSKLVFLNGTMGLYEDDKYKNGTLNILNILKNSNAKVILGGGDAVASSKKLAFTGSFYFESTGGGATLEYIANKTLEAIEYIKKI